MLFSAIHAPLHYMFDGPAGISDGALRISESLAGDIDFRLPPFEPRANWYLLKPTLQRIS